MSYKDVFVDSNGGGPYECFVCHEPVSRRELRVHHVDHDHYNDVPDNLVAVHHGCHSHHHNSGKVHTAETRRHMSEAHVGVKLSPEHAAAIRAGHDRSRANGRVWSVSDEGRKQLREANRRRRGLPHVEIRLKCRDCDMVTTAGPLRCHEIASGHGQGFDRYLEEADA